MKTGFHIVGWGVAVTDKVKGSITLKVNPKELLPNSHGKVAEVINTTTLDSKDNKGNSFSSKANWATYLECRWLDLFGHTPLPPDIRLGERVLIWRQGDSQTHFWTPSNLDLNKRLLEEVVIMASDTNQKDRKPKVLNYDNTYHIKLDTYDKYLRIRTCKNDSESFIHELLLDSKNEFSTLRDDVGNHLTLDSKNTIITLENKDKTKYELNKKDINVYCDGHYTHKTIGNYSIDIGGDFTEVVGGSKSIKIEGGLSTEVGGTITVNSGGTYSLSTGGNYTQDSPMVSVTTSSYSVVSPTSSFSGLVSCAGLSVGGGAKSFSTVKTATPLNDDPLKVGVKSVPACQVVGDMQITGDVGVSGKLTVGDFESLGGIKWAGDADGPQVPDWELDT